MDVGINDSNENTLAIRNMLQSFLFLVNVDFCINDHTIIFPIVILADMLNIYLIVHFSVCILFQNIQKHLFLGQFLFLPLLLLGNLRLLCCACPF